MSGEFEFKSTILRPVSLVGMMGSGKSLIGRRIAGALNLPFIDSDAEVEKAAGISISEIFELAGEKKFRDIERRVVTNAVGDGPIILSTGGGSICNCETAQLLCSETTIIWLRAEPETLMTRIGSTNSRPMLHGDDPLDLLRRLNTKRAPDYAKAHITVNTDGLSAVGAANAVMRALDTHLAVT